MYQKKNRGLSPTFVAYVEKGQKKKARKGQTTVYYLDRQSIKQSRYLEEYDLTKHWFLTAGKPKLAKEGLASQLVKRINDKKQIHEES